MGQYFLITRIMLIILILMLIIMCLGLLACYLLSLFFFFPATSLYLDLLSLWTENDNILFTELETHFKEKSQPTNTKNIVKSDSAWFYIFCGVWIWREHLCRTHVQFHTKKYYFSRLPPKKDTIPVSSFPSFKRHFVPFWLQMLQTEMFPWWLEMWPLPLL